MHPTPTSVDDREPAFSHSYRWDATINLTGGRLVARNPKMEENWIDPLPWNEWEKMTDQQRKAHIAERKEREEIATDLIVSKGAEIVFQTSGAFRDDWNYGDVGEQYADVICDVVFSHAFY